MLGNRKQNLRQFVSKVTLASKGENAASKIQNAVTTLLRSYGIETPVRK